jgi:tyrosine-protein kinase
MAVEERQVKVRPAPSSRDWRTPQVEQVGLQRYVQTVRERGRMIMLILLLTLGAAGAYLVTAEKLYKADADLLVTPVTGGEGTSLNGLGLISQSSDPTRDVETAARLVTTRDVAARVKDKLQLPGSASDLLGQVEATPIAQSNIVAITAEADSPELARDLANGFGQAVIADRTEGLHTQVDKSITRLRQRISAGDDPGGPNSLADQLSQLETLRAQDDPTLKLETVAEAPSSPSSPKPKLTMAAALVAGLVLGVGGAFALNALDPRLRREEQLRESYRLPILARIPKEKRARTSVREPRRGRLGLFRRKVRKALGPGELSPATVEAYRTLRAMLAAARIGRGQGRSVLITGASPSEGKTTTAINLASSLALAGHRVILIEADFRRPTVGAALGIRPAIGIGKVLLGSVKLEDALVPAKPFGQNLRLLLVDRGDDWLAELLSLPAAGALLEEAESLAEYVVIDSPPLTEVIDALPLAQQVDDLVLVVRLGSTRLPQLSRLSDLLAQNGIAPTGIAVVGVGSSEEEGYYLSSRRERLQEQPLDAERRPDFEPTT